MKDSNRDSSITFRVSKRVFIVISAIVILAGSAGIGTLLIQNETVGSMVRSCVERYTKGLEYKTYKVKLSFPIDSGNRDSLNQEQLSCISKKLGLNEEQKDSLLKRDKGQVDNDSFQVKWDTRTTCDLTDREGLVPAWVSKYSIDRSAACLETTDEWKATNVRTLKEIVVRDFRP